MENYNPKPKKYTRCIICGERAANDKDIIGCKRKNGGEVCAHKSCWEKEQSKRREGDEDSRNYPA